MGEVEGLSKKKNRERRLMVTDNSVVIAEGRLGGEVEANKW